MNELYVGECWIYFKTKKDSYDEAMSEFLKACNDAGIEITIDKAELRDEDLNVID